MHEGILIVTLPFSSWSNLFLFLFTQFVINNWFDYAGAILNGFMQLIGELREEKNAIKNYFIIDTKTKDDAIHRERERERERLDHVTHVTISPFPHLFILELYTR